jgi:hypothetical protein
MLRAEYDEVTVIRQWKDSSLITLLLGAVALPSSLDFSHCEEARRCWAKMQPNDQTAQAWEHRGADSCWRKSARVLKLASCRISDI